jgi:hypothetical protein
VLRFAAVLTGDRTSSEDIVQEVLIRAHARWSRIGALDRPDYYVRKMILNEFLSDGAARGALFRLAAQPTWITGLPGSCHQSRRPGCPAGEMASCTQQRAVVVLRYTKGSPMLISRALLRLAPNCSWLRFAGAGRPPHRFRQRVWLPISNCRSERTSTMNRT